jgi:hypothetical protein
VLRNVAPVEVTRITFEEIRNGGWKTGRPAASPVTSPDLDAP